MVNVIVAFPRAEDAKNVRSLLVRHGFSVPAVCTTGAAAISHAESLDDGIVVCGYRFPDMIYSELRRTSRPMCRCCWWPRPNTGPSAPEGTWSLWPCRFKAHDLIATLEMMAGEARGTGSGRGQGRPGALLRSRS